MRKILFKGKRIDNGGWIYGSPIFQDGYVLIRFWNSEEFKFEEHLVAPESVYEFTGLIDKSGKKIFEGDIVKAQDDIFGSPFCNGITGKVVYEETAFFIEPKDPMETQWLFNECAVYEIIGNIHDNPELLKESEQ